MGNYSISSLRISCKVLRIFLFGFLLPYQKKARPHWDILYTVKGIYYINIGGERNSLILLFLPDILTLHISDLRLILEILSLSSEVPEGASIGQSIHCGWLHPLEFRNNLLRPLIWHLSRPPHPNWLYNPRIHCSPRVAVRKWTTSRLPPVLYPADISTTVL